MTNQLQKIHILDKNLIECLLKQGAELLTENSSYYVNGWTQGIAELDITNSNNNATYLCWYTSKGNAVGVKAYFDQFKPI